MSLLPPRGQPLRQLLRQLLPWLGVLWLATAAAQNPQPGIDAIRRSVQNSALDEAQRTLVSSLLDTAASEKQQARDFLAQLAGLHADAAALPARLERLHAATAIDRERALQDWAARLPANADGETLEHLLAQERSTVAALTTEIESVTTDLARGLAGPAQMAGELGALRLRIEELSLPAAAAPDEPAVLAEARRAARTAELRRARAELDFRQAEQESADDRQRLDELKLRELRLRRGLHQQRIALLQNRIAEFGQRELRALLTRLLQREAELAAQPGPASTAATRNRELGDELIAQSADLSSDRRNLALYEQSRDRVAVARRDSERRLELGGTSEAVGRWLWSERRRLESPARLRQRLETLRGTLAELRLRRVVLNEEQRDLDDIPAAARQLAAATGTGGDEDGSLATSSDALLPLLRQRNDLLAALEPVAERRIATLELGEHALQQQLDDTLLMRQLLDRHLLWTPSHQPIDGNWLHRVPEGLRDLVKPARLKTTLRLTWEEVQARPLRWLGSVILVLGLYLLHRRARARIEELAAPARRLGPDSLSATLRAIVWTLLAALPGAATLWLLGDLLQSVGNPGRYSDSLGRACIRLVVPLFAVQLLRCMVMERGLAHAHFRWMRSRRAALRKALPRTAAIVLPLYFITTLAFIRNLDLPNDVQARAAIMLACATLAWTLWRLLDAGVLWVVRGITVEPSRSRQLLRAGLPAALICIAALALGGYVYTAGLLLQALIMTFAMLVAVSLATGLLGRWFLLGERRLYLQRTGEQRGAGDGGEEPEGEMTLEQINAQTGRLLRALRLTLVAGGLILVWAPVLPAITRLDAIALWHFSETGVDGNPVMHPVTLMAVVLGLASLALTVISARNLPGLIEIGLLSKTSIDAASRYAVTSILRYVIVIAGTLIGLGLFGLRWSQLQWMAAALTVGLGFGLQEIFANFVSGLILLFERPFRIGDVITVDTFTGRVTRIRTRATTMLDFENKEIVIPNKNFITGQLTNWTLTDDMIRITIRVGVAYGSDPARVHELLLEAARQCPMVLAEPKPVSLFMAFGASSLDFELRLFIGAVNERFPVQNDLNANIVRLFAEHGIEIAFPQIDVHVRDLPKN